MSTYKEINGTAIEVLSADPPNPQDGQVWYRSDLGTFKTQKTSAAGAWATAADTNNDRRLFAGVGTQTAALAMGGNTSKVPTPPGAEVMVGITEAYNGTTWTELNDMNEGRERLGGAGTQTSSLVFGGDPNVTLAPIVAKTESWNGTNWTEVNDLNAARYLIGGGGIRTSALAFGGSIDPGIVGNTESWNGTSWTEVNDLNTARYNGGEAGSDNTSILIFGGDPGTVALTESWNGTNWTEVNDLNTARDTIGGTGTQTAALAAGGSPAPSGETESWNGTSWTEVNDLNDIRGGNEGAGTTTAALTFGGTLGPVYRKTEEFNAPAVVTETITLE